MRTTVAEVLGRYYEKICLRSMNYYNRICPYKKIFLLRAVCLNIYGICTANKNQNETMCTDNKNRNESML